MLRVSFLFPFTFVQSNLGKPIRRKASSEVGGDIDRDIDRYIDQHIDRYITCPICTPPVGGHLEQAAP